MTERQGVKRLRQISIGESFASVIDKSRRLSVDQTIMDTSPDSGIVLQDGSAELSASVVSSTSINGEEQKQEESSADSLHDPKVQVAAVQRLELKNCGRLMAVTISDRVDDETPPMPDTQTTAVGPADTHSDSEETQIDFTPPQFDISDVHVLQSDDDNDVEGLLSLGTPLNEMRRNPGCSLPLPTLKSTSDHAVLFKLGHDSNETWSERCKDVWDEDHVRMPCSPLNLYPVMNDRTGEKQLEERWTLILQALNRDIRSSKDLQAAILSYNTRYTQRWNFNNLHRLFDQLEDDEAALFFRTTLPRMIRLALRLPELVPVPLPLLKQGRTRTITMNQMQAASLLANAFFCTFPRRNTHGKYSEYRDYPHINFANLFNGRRFANKNSRSRIESQLEKLKCLLHYFRRVTTNEPRGTLSFKRQHLTDYPRWNDSKRQFSRLHVTSQGSIEDDGDGMLQVDFANMYVGGGVLSQGCVQEEIRFVICPELIVSMLLAEKMTNNECVIITGCERFSHYTGYSDSFEWRADYVDVTPRDAWGRKCIEVVAIDAKPFRNSKLQYEPEWLKREINKAYCGFSSHGNRSENLAAVATGNWGCGVFQGEPRFKALLQMMAAAEAGRDIVYFTFGNAQLCRDIHAMHRFICEEKRATVGLVVNILEQYNSAAKRVKEDSPKLYEFLRVTMTQYDSDTDVEDASTIN